MKKYIILIPVVILALMPPIQVNIPISDSSIMSWIVLVFGFLGICTLFFKISPFIKAFSVLGFINCFFSTCPYISHFAYIELVLCIYLYIISSQIDDWKPVFNAVWGLLALNVILLAMQVIHKDNLLNFGLSSNISTLSIGNKMQAKSYILILIAILAQDKRIKLSPNVIIIATLTLPCFAIYYFFSHNVLVNTLTYRGPVWLETVKLSLNHPIMGYGIGQYKVLFNSLATLPSVVRVEGVWYQAHNFFAQIFFEMGLSGLIVAGFYVISLFKNCFNGKDERLLLGLCLIFYTLFVHFPDRQITTAPLLILFLSYTDHRRV